MHVLKSSSIALLNHVFSQFYLLVLLRKIKYRVRFIRYGHLYAYEIKSVSSYNSSSLLLLCLPFIKLMRYGSLSINPSLDLSLGSFNSANNVINAYGIDFSIFIAHHYELQKAILKTKKKRNILPRSASCKPSQTALSAFC